MLVKMFFYDYFMILLILTMDLLWLFFPFPCFKMSKDSSPHWSIMDWIIVDWSIVDWSTELYGGKKDFARCTSGMLYFAF